MLFTRAEQSAKEMYVQPPAQLCLHLLQQKCASCSRILRCTGLVVQLNTLSIPRIALRRLWNETCRRLINKSCGDPYFRGIYKPHASSWSTIIIKELSSNSQKLSGTQNPSTKAMLLSTQQLFVNSNEGHHYQRG